MSKKNVKIKPNQLGETIDSILKEYSDDIVRQMPDVVKEVTQDTVKDLKKRASTLVGGKKYKKSFKSRLTTGYSGKTIYTVYSTEYRVAHLLENGHVIKNKTGRIYGRTSARPHWGPAEEQAIKNLEKKLSKKIQEG